MSLDSVLTLPCWLCSRCTGTLFSHVSKFKHRTLIRQPGRPGIPPLSLFVGCALYVRRPTPYLRLFCTQEVRLLRDQTGEVIWPGPSVWVGGHSTTEGVSTHQVSTGSYLTLHMSQVLMVRAYWLLAISGMTPDLHLESCPAPAHIPSLKSSP